MTGKRLALRFRMTFFEFSEPFVIVIAGNSTPCLALFNQEETRPHEVFGIRVGRPPQTEPFALIPETGDKEVQLLPAECVPAILASYLPKSRPPKKLPEVELLSFHVLRRIYRARDESGGHLPGSLRANANHDPN